MKQGGSRFAHLLLLLTVSCGDGDSPGKEWTRPAELGDAPVKIQCKTSPCIQSIAMGTWHTCAVDGRVWCWGNNSTAALGIGRPDEDPHPPTAIVFPDL